MTIATQAACAANRALRENPHVRSAGDLWVLNAAKARQCCEDWSRMGIPDSTILGAISRVCGAFKPSPENPRIGSFRYFDAAVRKAHLENQPKVDPMDAVIAQLEAESR